MDEDIRKEPKQSIFVDSNNSEPSATVQPAEPVYEALSHPKAVVSSHLNAKIAQALPKTRKRIAMPPQKVTLTVVSSLLILALGASVFVLIRKNQSITNPVGQANTNVATPTISLYYPKNLPSGYAYGNDLKTLKENVYYFTVSGPKQSTFYVTQQQIPASFDFTAFSKKFSTPDNFSTTSGTVTAGPVGGSLLASIRTNKNTWIIVNSSPSATQAQLETIARAFELE